METKITKEQFTAYETVRQSGVTNMFDIPIVIASAYEFTGELLTKEIILEIMQNYGELEEQYIA